MHNLGYCVPSLLRHTSAWLTGTQQEPLRCLESRSNVRGAYSYRGDPPPCSRRYSPCANWSLAPARRHPRPVQTQRGTHSKVRSQAAGSNSKRVRARQRHQCYTSLLYGKVTLTRPPFSGRVSPAGRGPITFTNPCICTSVFD